MAESRFKVSLKLFNSAMGLGGIAIIMYCVFMFKVWQLDGKGSSSHHNTTPSFLHSLLAVGIALCAITCLGHIAASMANFSWLYSYIVILLLLLLLETVILADAFVDPNWKEERFEDLMDFVQSINYISKWIVWLIFLIQAICVLLATLRIHETNLVHIYDSEEEEEEEEDDPEPVLPVFGRRNHWLQSDPNIV